MRILTTSAFLIFGILPSLHGQDTTVHIKRKKIIKAFAAPVLLTAAGVYMIDGDHDNDFINRYWVKKERDERFRNFHTKMDVYHARSGGLRLWS